MASSRDLRNAELTLRRKDGRKIVVLENSRAVTGDEGEVLYYEGTLTDITEAHERSRQLSFEASHDALTGLLNRREFENRLQQAIDTTQATDTSHAVCYLDLDQFKIINDTCGHIAGDELLRQLAQVLSEKIRTNDCVARLGDEQLLDFVVAKLRETGVSAARVGFEITETAAINNLTSANQLINALKQLGCKFAARRLWQRRVVLCLPESAFSRRPQDRWPVRQQYRERTDRLRDGPFDHGYRARDGQESDCGIRRTRTDPGETLKDRLRLCAGVRGGRSGAAGRNRLKESPARVGQASGAASVVLAESAVVALAE